MGLGIITVIALSYLFYHSVWWSIPLLVGLIPYGYVCARALERNKRERFCLQLRDFLQLLSGNLQAGDSMEHAMEHSLPELAQQWGTDSFIYRDVGKMIRQLSLSHQSTKVLTAWGQARKDEELIVFLQVFLYGKKAGSDLCRLIAKTTDSISKRIETKQEITTLLASQTYEQEIMSAMPMLLLFYVEITNPGYLAPLYGNPGGYLFMTLCLALYGGCVLLGMRILRIEVMG
ncbi:tight adherence protein B [Lachnospiraceae bacterium XBB1006]|nr:tight adherence protein B [Lachnospiraceae bacterium XBB1006]